MKIWIVTVGEPVPSDPGGIRLWRSGILCEQLAQKGHEVTWWNSNFDHFTKRNRFKRGKVLEIHGYKIRFLEGRSYTAHVGWQRLVHNIQVAHHFAQIARSVERPDLILCSFPTIELSLVATNLGKKWGVPVLLDVRDLWPDLFVSALPVFLRPMAPLLLFPYTWMTRKAFSKAIALIAITPSYLNFGLRYANRKPGKLDRVFFLECPQHALSKEQMELAQKKILDLGVNPHKTLVWFSGSFGRSCGLQPLIQAAERLIQEGVQDLQFVLSGTGVNEKEWRLKAKNFPNIIFTGWNDLPELKAIANLASVGVCAYVANASQQMPNKFLEYLSHGLPLLSSLEGETRGFLERNNCGLYFNPLLKFSFYEMLLKLVKDIREGRYEKKRILEVFDNLQNKGSSYEQWVEYLTAFNGIF